MGCSSVINKDNVIVDVLNCLSIKLNSDIHETLTSTVDINDSDSIIDVTVKVMDRLRNGICARMLMKRPWEYYSDDKISCTDAESKKRLISKVYYLCRFDRVLRGRNADVRVLNLAYSALDKDTISYLDVIKTFVTIYYTVNYCDYDELDECLDDIRAIIADDEDWNKVDKYYEDNYMKFNSNHVYYIIHDLTRQKYMSKIDDVSGFFTKTGVPCKLSDAELAELNKKLPCNNLCDESYTLSIDDTIEYVNGAIVPVIVNRYDLINPFTDLDKLVVVNDVFIYYNLSTTSRYYYKLLDQIDINNFSCDDTEENIMNIAFRTAEVIKNEDSAAKLYRLSNPWETYSSYVNENNMSLKDRISYVMKTYGSYSSRQFVLLTNLLQHLVDNYDEVKECSIPQLYDLVVATLVLTVSGKEYNEDNIIDVLRGDEYKQYIYNYYAENYMKIDDKVYNNIAKLLGVSFDRYRSLDSYKAHMVSKIDDTVAEFVSNKLGYIYNPEYSITLFNSNKPYNFNYDGLPVQVAYAYDAITKYNSQK